MTPSTSDREAVARTEARRLEALRREAVRACFDPGAVLGPRGERSTDEWRADAVMKAVAAPILAQLVTLREQLAAAEARAEEAEKVLVGQTPDGSEYHTKGVEGYHVDIQRCARFITEDRASKHDLIRKTILAKNAAEAEVSRLNAALSEERARVAGMRERAAKVAEGHQRCLEGNPPTSGECVARGIAEDIRALTEEGSHAQG